MGHNAAAPFICNQNALMRQPPPPLANAQRCDNLELSSNLSSEDFTENGAAQETGSSGGPFVPTEHYGASRIASPRSIANVSPQIGRDSSHGSKRATANARRDAASIFPPKRVVVAESLSRICALGNCLSFYPETTFLAVLQCRSPNSTDSLEVKPITRSSHRKYHSPTNARGKIPLFDGAVPPTRPCSFHHAAAAFSLPFSSLSPSLAL